MVCLVGYFTVRNQIQNLIFGGGRCVRQQVGSRQSLNCGCSEQPEASGGWSAGVTWSLPVMLLQNTSGVIIQLLTSNLNIASQKRQNFTQPETVGDSSSVPVMRPLKSHTS